MVSGYPSKMLLILMEIQKQNLSPALNLGVVLEIRRGERMKHENEHGNRISTMDRAQAMESTLSIVYYSRGRPNWGRQT